MFMHSSRARSSADQVSSRFVPSEPMPSRLETDVAASARAVLQSLGERP
jgi:hypothetical protein